jgi:hypothetical protein
MARPRTINRRVAEQGVRLSGAGIVLPSQTSPGAILGLREQKTTPDTSTSVPDALEPVLASMTEAEFQWHVRTALEVRGWKCYVVPDMRKTLAGLPDILALHPRHALVLALELKSATGRVRKKQREFLDMAVRVPGVIARVVRPADWLALRDVLDDLEARWRGTPAAEEV